MEAEMKKLQDTADLFEVSFPDYKQLHRCRSDIILVKAVWDMVIFVKVQNNKETTFSSVNITRESQIEYFILLSMADQYRGLDQDSMERDQRWADGHGAQTIRQSTTSSHWQTDIISNSLRGLKQTVKLSVWLSVCCTLKEMKMLDKEVRVWNVYMGLESTVKNLLTSLRAINELQNSAVRERHWQQLMNTTGVWDSDASQCLIPLHSILFHNGSHSALYMCHYWSKFWSSLIAFMYCTIIELSPPGLKWPAQLREPNYPALKHDPTHGCHVLFVRSGLSWGRAPPWGTFWNYSFTGWRTRSKT